MKKKLINLRVSEQEYERFVEVAKHHGETLSECIRRLLNNESVKIEMSKEGK